MKLTLKIYFAMHLGEISFCDRVGFNIKSDEIKNKLLVDLENICGFKVIQKHYESFQNANFPRINSMPYVMSLRTNGNPYLLYLTKHNNENQCIFIDKKIQHGYCFPRMIVSKLWFDNSLFEGTLFDGEMIKTNNGDWHYIINDLICLNNQVLEKVNIIKRLEYVYEILHKKYIIDDFNCCKVFVKRYFKVSEVDYMLDAFIYKLPYTCRGIYFKPFYLKFREILLNFDDNLIQKVVRFKYKHLDGETFKDQQSTSIESPAIQAIQAIPQMQLQLPQPPPPPQQSLPLLVSPHVPQISQKVFHVKKTNNTDIYELYENSNDSKPHSIALVNTIKTTRLLHELFRNVNIIEKIKMHCIYNEKFQKFTPIGLFA